ncbi:FAD dependent oxidoreductase-domain-containing protein [Crucibulum laeve]|uniref:FAD dependent oxidoreductase-domain-containing protein n=1 Tax=Crucibulum laeve TaxID=68775 RepID=A0A5C3LSP1_9AGAR|nr:FAD dependent oxidoreductase-domain-containing protein [Crucibulum laeve]
MVQSTLNVPTHQFDAAQAVFEAPFRVSSHDSTTTPNQSPLKVDFLNAGERDPKWQATLPVPNPTRAFWTDSSPDANPLAREGSTGELTEEADVCIVGSGITGVSAAWHLGRFLDERKDGKDRKKVKAVILEARDFCSGATGRNGGHLTPSVFLDFQRRSSLYNTSEVVKAYQLENYTADALVSFLEQQKLGDEVDLVEGGHITLFVTPEEEESAIGDYEAALEAGMGEMLKEKGIAWIGREEMEETYGASFPGVKFKSHNVWPLKLVTQLYKHTKSKFARSIDLVLHTHTPVTYIKPQEKTVSAKSNTTSSNSTPVKRYSVVTPRGPLQCNAIIHATNAYASYLLPHLAGPGGVVPTRGQVVAVRAKVGEEELGGRNSWDGNEGFEYWFPRPVRPAKKGGDTAGEGVEEEEKEKPLIILGGGREVTGPGFEFYETDDSGVNEEVGEVLGGFLPGLFPGKYERGGVEMEWTGIMGYTRTGDPFVGTVFDPALNKEENEERWGGQYVAAGYTGHGMPRGYACAEVVAGMVAAELTGEEWAAPRWLPEHYLTTTRGSDGL